MLEKLDKTHEDLCSNIGNKKQQILSMTNDEEDFQISINTQLPLKDEVGLLFFENKLIETSFRNKMVKCLYTCYLNKLYLFILYYYLIKYVFNIKKCSQIVELSRFGRNTLG